MRWRVQTRTRPGPDVDLAPHQSRWLSVLPREYDALTECLVLGGDPVAAADRLGRTLAATGHAIEEALAGVERVYEVVVGDEPAYAVTRALVTAWTDESLQFAHAITCEDALTGLASLAHLRTRVRDLHREAEGAGRPVGSTHALLIVEIVEPYADTDPLTRSLMVGAGLEITDVGALLRTAFDHETIARVGDRAVVVLMRRDRRLGDAVRGVHELLASRDRGGSAARPRHRVWIESLPDTAAAADAQLAELAH